MVKGSWRDRLSPLIKEVIEENSGKSEKEIRAALREAYPLGPKKYWPYKVWLSEIKRQLHPVVEYRQRKKKIIVDKNQLRLL